MFFYADLPAVPSGARLEGRSIYRGDAMIEFEDEAAGRIMETIWGKSLPRHIARIDVEEVLKDYKALILREVRDSVDRTINEHHPRAKERTEAGG